MAITSNRLVAVDTETTGLNPWLGDQPFAFSFCDDEWNTAYYEFKVHPKTRKVLYEQSSRQFRILKRWVARSKGQPKVFWNLKFDRRMIDFNVGVLPPPYYDGIFAAHACRPSEPTFGLKQLAWKYGDIPQDDQKELQRFVVKLRRKAKKLGWNIAKDVSADYWLVMYAKELGMAGSECRQCREACERYAVLDAERTMLLWQFYDHVMDELDVRKIFEHETELHEVVYEMERRGTHVNLRAARLLRDQHEEARKQYLSIINAYGEKAREKGLLNESGQSKGFNANSPAQMAAVLYDYLGLEIPEEVFEYKRKGQEVSNRSVKSDVLQSLIPQHRLPDIILRMRAVTKGIEQMDTYEKYGLEVESDLPGKSCFRLHPNFRQSGTRTGRFSCVEPNLMQVATEQTSRGFHPIDSRGPFGPSPGCVWYCMDYSQQEIRIMASESNEPTMLEIIRSGQDIHDAVTNRVWGGTSEPAIRAAMQALGVGEHGGGHDDSELMQAARKKFRGRNDRLTALNFLGEYEGDIVKAEKSLGKKNTRNKAKMISFNKAYGGGTAAVMLLAKVSQEEARQLLDDWDRGFPRFKPWARKMENFARKHGYVRNAFGRRITVEKDGAYKCVNYIIQGGAADLVKRAMVGCHKYIQENKLPAWLLLNVHDELVFEFLRSSDRMHHVRRLREIMEDDGGAYKVPMIVEVDIVYKKWTVKKPAVWANR